MTLNSPGRHPKIGLVLGGGGLAGYVYMIAALKALQNETNWDARSAKVIVGTSAGANAGAYLRSGQSVDDLFNELATLPDHPETVERLKSITGDRRAFLAIPDSTTSWHLVKSEFGRGREIRLSRLLSAIAPSGPVKTSKVGDQLRNLLPAWPVNELLITAVRLDDGSRVAFDGSQRTDIVKAVEASSAIPGFFTPVEINGVVYVDGGVHSPTNADLIQSRELDLVVIIAPMSIRSYKSGWRNVNGPLRMFWKNKVAGEVRGLKAAGHQVLLFEPSKSVVRAMGPTMMDVDRTAEILHRTFRSSEAMFDSEDVQQQLEILGQSCPVTT